MIVPAEIKTTIARFRSMKVFAEERLGAELAEKRSASMSPEESHGFFCESAAFALSRNLQKSRWQTFY